MTTSMQPRIDRTFSIVNWLVVLSLLLLCHTGRIPLAVPGDWLALQVTAPMGYLIVYVESEVVSMCGI